MQSMTAVPQDAVADEPEAAVPAEAGSFGPRRARWLQALACFGIYLAASAALCRHVFSAYRTSVIGLTGGDDSLFTWWLAYTPWALLHGHSPLVSNYLNAPGGVNGMWNTSVPLLGILGAPITLTAGPTATLNTMTLLGPAVSGAVAFAVLRRYMHPAAAFVAGAMYGFSPFVLAHLVAVHLNLLWNVFPPLLVLFVDEMAIRQRIRWWKLGLGLGAALVVQAGLYTQTIGLAVAIAVVVLIVMAIRWPHEIRPRIGYLVKTALVAAATFLVVCAYPLYELVRGPYRPTGSIRDEFYFVADLANVWVPTPWNYGWFGLGARNADMRLNGAEQGFYLGIVVLAACLLALVALRSVAVSLIGLGGLIAAIYSLGPQLVVFNDAHGPKYLPFRFIAHLPLLENIESVRFTVFVGFAGAALVGFVLDRALTSRDLRWRVGGGLLALAAAVSWLPAVTRFPPISPLAAPGFFLTDKASEIQAGSTVRTVPRASPALPGHAVPMAWQAWTGMRFKLHGGYFVGSQNGVNINEAVTDAFDAATDAIAATGIAPAAGSPEFAAAQAALAAQPVDDIVVVPLPGTGPQDVLIGFVTALTGVQPVATGGVFLYKLTR
jgi:hypothetical protein